MARSGSGDPYDLSRVYAALDRDRQNSAGNGKPRLDEESDLLWRLEQRAASGGYALDKRAAGHSALAFGFGSQAHSKSALAGLRHVRNFDEQRNIDGSRTITTN